MTNKSFKTASLLLFGSMMTWLAVSCTSNVQATSPASPEKESVSAMTAEASSAQANRGPMVDKSRDTVLQTMVSELLPKFRRLSYKDPQTGLTVDYNLFIPRNVDSGKKYPMIVFLADASVAGYDVTRALSQGYGGLVWSSFIEQAKNPCYILVPAYAGVVVNEGGKVTPEADAIFHLIKNVSDERNVDKDRIYVAGQAMGGSLAMHYVMSEKDFFAASLFVNCHSDSGMLKELAGEKFIFVNSGDSGNGAKCMNALRDIMHRSHRSVADAGWSARLSGKRQNQLAGEMLARGCDVNLIYFDAGTVLPDDGKGSEQMYGFDYAFRLEPVRRWMFRQHR